MPRKSKVTAVPVEQPEATVAEEEPNTEAQEMTEVLNDIKGVEVEEPVVADVAPEEPVAQPKAKPKRASRAKAKVASAPEPVIEVKEVSPEDVTVEVEVPQEVKTDAKVADKVSCPDCGKQMSAKTLKYSHGPNCLVKKKEAQEAKTDQGGGSNIPEEMIEKLVQSRMNNVKKERLAKREQALEKLVAGALPS